MQAYRSQQEKLEFSALTGSCRVAWCGVTRTMSALAPSLRCKASVGDNHTTPTGVCRRFGLLTDSRCWVAVVCCCVGAYGTAAHAQNRVVAALAIDDAVASHPLLAEERARFESDGFLVLPNVLSANELEALSGAMDEWSQYMGGVPEGTTWHGMTFDKRHDMPLRHVALVKLLVHPRVFGKIVGILGWNIYCYHAHAMFTRASSSADAELTEPSGDHWHQDSGRVNADVEGEPRPRLSVKASFFLTDTTQPDGPQFWAVPGSHLNNSIANVHAGATEQPPGATRIPVPAGSVVIIDRRLWHAGPLGEQPYPRSRKVLFYGFGPRWMRPKDSMATERLLEHVHDPVLRQLLGDTPTYNGLYSPTARDAPLLDWLDSRGMLGERPPVPWEACDQSSKWIGGCT